MDQDGAEGRGADAAEREAAELEREIAGAENQGDRRDQQVSAVGEVDLVVDPDARAGDGDQAVPARRGPSGSSGAGPDGP